MGKSFINYKLLGWRNSNMLACGDYFSYILRSIPATIVIFLSGNETKHWYITHFSRKNGHKCGLNPEFSSTSKLSYLTAITYILFYKK